MILPPAGRHLFTDRGRRAAGHPGAGAARSEASKSEQGETLDVAGLGPAVRGERIRRRHPS